MVSATKHLTAEQGREILKSHESDTLISQPTMLDAARKAVELAR